MEIKAESKSVKISPRKVSLLADMVRNMSIEQAINALSLANKRAATSLLKTLKSALANAINNAKLQKENLIIKSINVSGGPALKRFKPSTRGRVHPFKKRSSNIRIVLEEKNEKK
ncbi:MAG: 50S ribosomal protein L22 [Candidatus Levyibacteriota bacterium]